MPAERYYLDSPFLSLTVTLEGDELHHLAHVMRAKEGDTVELVNGRGVLALAAIVSIQKSEAQLKINSMHQETKRPIVILAQAMTRQNHLEWIIEKGTELGVCAFWLFPGERSEKTEFNEERLKRLTISAMKQCGRLTLPALEKKPPLSAWKPIGGALYFGDPQSKDILSKPSKEPAVFFIGPEKGFSPSEQEILRCILKARGIKLHDNILRTETASLVALSQCYLFLRNSSAPFGS